jgi:cell shape-determining protein MreC
MGPSQTVKQKLREAGLVAGILLVALLALRSSAKHPGELSTLDRAILTVVTPAQSTLSVFARGLRGFSEHYVDLVHVRTENEQLRRENSRLRAELIDAKRTADESGRLRRLLGLRDSLAAATLVARVISIDASPYFRMAQR